MYRNFLLPLLLLYFPATSASPLLEEFTAEYNISRNGMALGVTSRQLLKTSNTTYQFSSNTQAEGIVALFVSDVITEQSDIQYHDKQLRPVKYVYRQTGGRKEKLIEIIFDWKNKRVQHSRKPEIKQLADNSHDLLSFQLMLSQTLQQQQQKSDITIIDHKRSQTHTVSVVGKEIFPTSAGQLETIRLEQKARNNRYHFSFWYAPQFGYLPVIVKKTEHDGDVITMKLRRFNGKPFSFINNNDSDD